MIDSGFVADQKSANAIELADVERAHAPGGYVE